MNKTKGVATPEGKFSKELSILTIVGLVQFEEIVHELVNILEVVNESREKFERHVIRESRAKHLFLQ